MSLEPGKKLGPYEILSSLGAGGMGEVYRAKDTRLDRTVAVKVLPSQFSADPELRERFDREAKAISGLNHPHICTLHDVGHEDGIDFLVMELLEGENLAERLKKGPLSFDDAMKTGTQIADALAMAHRHGVIHRDLKPANVVLTKDGAKLLDFGLAKQHESGPADEASALSSLPTEARALTGKGELLGTFQYMAPEQLEGKPVTPSMDIFALGAVLYEMVAGRRAFDGGNPASLISVIMTAEPPPPSSFGATSPPALDALIRGCLAKDPSERWQSASDVSRQLKWIAEGGVLAAESRPAERSRVAAGTLAVGIALGALVAGLVLWMLRLAPVEALPLKVAITVPASEPLRGNVALSPDGRTLVYVGFRDGKQQIFRRALDEWQAAPVRGTEGGTSISVSPDGEWVAFMTASALKKVSLSGGEPVTLCEECAGSAGTSWGANDRVAFTSGGGLADVPASGGIPNALTTPPAGVGHVEAHWLPRGNGLLFSAAGEVHAVDLETGELHVLLAGRAPQYTSSGHLVVSRNGTLWAVPFDDMSLKLLGEPVPVLENVLVNENGFARFSLSYAGTLVYVASVLSDGSTIVWVDRTGQAETLVNESDSYQFPRLSPDGKKLVVSTAVEGVSSIWVVDLERGTRTRVVMDGNIDYPEWTPDGTRVTFVGREEGTWGVYSKRADGTGEAELLLRSEQWLTTLAWHPTAEFLAIERQEVGPSDLVLMDASGEVSPLEKTPFNETAPTFSPDGSYLAYVSDETGEREVYVRTFPGSGGKWAISRGGGVEPVWSRDGRSLYYRAGGEVWVTPVQLGPDFQAGASSRLFDLPYGVRNGPLFTTPNYDVSPDGERLVMIQSAGDVLTEARVILNWSEELKRLAPVR